MGRDLVFGTARALRQALMDERTQGTQFLLQALDPPLLAKHREVERFELILGGHQRTFDRLHATVHTRSSIVQERSF